MGVCPICNKNVTRGSGWIMQEYFEPSIHKIFVHHSRYDKCFETHCKQEKEQEENKRKKSLGFPLNPLEELLK